MSGFKRSHDEFLAAEAAADTVVPSSAASSPKQITTSDTPEAGDEHISKKLKQTEPKPKDVQEEKIRDMATSSIATASRKAVSLAQKQVPTMKEATSAIADEEMTDAPSSNEGSQAEPSSGTNRQLKKAVPRKSGGKPKYAAMHADQEMSDAPSSDGEDESSSHASHSVLSGRGAVLPFTPLPRILARHFANNKYAPSTSTAREAYRKEVRQLLLHPQHNPMETPNSEVSEPVRHAIYERYFLGKTNEECLETWNSYGGTAKSAQAISKILLRDTATWFAEENAVLPWMARKNDEKAELKKLGMRPEHFPAPHTTTPPSTNGIRARNVNKSKKQSDTNASRSSAGKPSKNRAVQQANTVANTSSTRAGSRNHVEGNQDQDPSDSDSDESDSSSSDDDSSFSDDDSDSESSDVGGHDDKPVVAMERYAAKIAKEISNEPPMRSLIMAASNAFALEGHSTTALIVDGHRYNVRSDCLIKHCGFVRNSVANGRPFQDVSLDDRDPQIVRAFIQAITAGNRQHEHRLPQYDFDFEFAHNQALHGWDHSDPVGVVDGDRRKFRKIDWDLETCMVMYELAMNLDCNLVRNLVVDQIRILLTEEEAALREGKVLKQSQIPLDYLNELPLNTESRFICILGVMHKNRRLYQPNDGAPLWPAKMSGNVITAVEKWIAHEDDAVSMDLRKRYCHRFHRHDQRESCHIFTGDEDLRTTEEMISSLFSGLRKAERQCTAALADFEKQDPDDILACNVIRFRGQMMQWTFRREEKIANELLELERARDGLSEGNPDEVDRDYCERMHIKWTHHLKKLRTEHWDRWDLFEREWILGTKTEEAGRKPVNSGDESDEQLPWNGD